MCDFNESVRQKTRILKQGSSDMDLFTLGTILGAGIAIFTLSTLTFFERRRRDAKSFRSLVEQRINPKGDPKQTNDLKSHTVIMRPTNGFRIATVVVGALAMWFTWGPYLRWDSFDVTIALIITVVVFYLIVFVSNYEARYDSEGVTVPNWFFRDKRYEWAHLINTKDNGNLRYKIRFLDHGTLRLQKYLVGMPAYLTFMSDMEATNRES